MDDREFEADSPVCSSSGGQAMYRPLLARLVALPLTFVGYSACCQSQAFADINRARSSRLTSEERQELLQYANDTWRSFEKLALPSGLPADGLTRDGGGWGKAFMQTSPTNIAAYLWSTLAAERLKLISVEESRSRMEKTLATLARMERYHGFFLNDLDPRTGAALKVSPWDSTPRRPLLSAVDNAWLAAALLDGCQHGARLAQAGDQVAGAHGFSVLLRSLRPERSGRAIRASCVSAAGPRTTRFTATTGCSTRRPVSPAIWVSPAVKFPGNTTIACIAPCQRNAARRHRRLRANYASTWASRSSRAVTPIEGRGSFRHGAEACSRP